MSVAEFCDWEPCEFLGKFIISLLPVGRSARTVQALVVTAKSSARGDPPKRVTFYYCPFCGTRIHENKEILDWIDKKRGRHE